MSLQTGGGAADAIANLLVGGGGALSNDAARFERIAKLERRLTMPVGDSSNQHVAVPIQPQNLRFGFDAVAPQSNDALQPQPSLPAHASAEKRKGGNLNERSMHDIGSMPQPVNSSSHLARNAGGADQGTGVKRRKFVGGSIGKSPEESSRGEAAVAASPGEWNLIFNPSAQALQPPARLTSIHAGLHGSEQL